jgi:hypothetical protein
VATYQGSKVSEDRQRRVGDTDVRQGQEEHAGEKGVDRDTSLVDPLEDLGRLSLNCKLEQRSGTDVDVRVGGGEDEEQDAAVDEGGQELDTGESDGNNEGTRSSVGGTGRDPISSSHCFLQWECAYLLLAPASAVELDGTSKPTTKIPPT